MWAIRRTDWAGLPADRLRPLPTRQLRMVADLRGQVAHIAYGVDQALADGEQVVQSGSDERPDALGQGVDGKRDVDDTGSVEGCLRQLSSQVSDDLRQFHGVGHVLLGDAEQPAADELGLD